MRIVFMGATELGYQCCERLFDLGEQVVGILSIEKKFPISYASNGVTNVLFRSFADLAEEHGVPLVHVTGMSDPELLETLESWRPEFALAVGWYYMVPRAIRELLPKGAAGIHGSMLPKYRGGAPLVWAMINGERATGETLFYYDEGVDTGDIIAQERIEIGEEDTIQDVLEKVTRASLALVEEYVPQVRAGTAPRVPQDHSVATEYPQRSPKDGLIDWSMSAPAIRNFVRAQTRPYPGAFFVANGKKVTLWDVDVEDLPSGEGAS
jgi:methionyl-tRNA formyltransferase